jgi:hypothetical protein
VLRGGSRVLQHGPSMICEVSGANATAVAGLLHPHGYRLYDGDQRQAPRAAEASAPPNTLAVRLPRSRDGELAGG